MSALLPPELYVEDDGFTEEDFAEQEWLYEYIFDHPATVGLEWRDGRADSDEVAGKIRYQGVDKWFNLDELHQLLNILDEEENAPFWKKMIEDWFEGSK